MKRKIHVNILALVFWVLVFVPQTLFSQAASISDEAAYRRMEQQFETPKISSEQLLLFEKKGVQHLKDFMNLVEMISTDDVDEKFRSRFEVAAIDYFSNPTDSIFLFDGKKESIISIENFVKNLGNKNSYFQEIKLSNFESTTPVFLEKYYSWKVSFLFSQKENSDKKMTAFFILKKKKKKFGSVEKEIWEVLLEKIKEEK